MSDTISLGLTLEIPSEGDANWAASIKSGCFIPISEHDHSGSGNGTPIGTAGLQNSAVTTAKIAAGNVNSTSIGDEAVATAHIQTDAVTEDKLAPDAASRSTYIIQAGEILADGTAAIRTLGRQDASVTAANTKVVVAPKACKVTHLLVALGAAITGGTLTITLYKNGATTGKTVAITSGSTNYAAIVAESFAAGDTIGLAVTLAGVTFSGGIAGVCADGLGHFTE